MRVREEASASEEAACLCLCVALSSPFHTHSQRCNAGASALQESRTCNSRMDATLTTPPTLPRLNLLPPSPAPTISLQIVARTMDYMKFMNTKVLFKQVRHMPKDQQPHPVMVHAK